jgi:hypothetical protein
MISDNVFQYVQLESASVRMSGNPADIVRVRPISALLPRTPVSHFDQTARQTSVTLTRNGGFGHLKKVVLDLQRVRPRPHHGATSCVGTAMPVDRFQPRPQPIPDRLALARPSCPDSMEHPARANGTCSAP